VAGAPFARSMPCMPCAFAGALTRAERVREGVEDDHDVCALGHAFGVDGRRGPATAPQWPPPPGRVAELAASEPGRVSGPS
jgi:hypothetical protein